MPAAIAQEVGYTLDRSPVTRRTNAETNMHIKFLINPRWWEMGLDSGRKPEYPERMHKENISTQ